MFKPVLIATLSLVAAYLYHKLRHLRLKQYRHFPQLSPGPILGHLKTFGDFLRRGKIDRHPDAVFAEMNESIGSPPIMFVDLRPVSDPYVVIAEHSVAEQISRASSLYPYSLPKISIDFMEPLLGSKSILTAHGLEWKTLRRRFNPGFSPQHLMTLLPNILDGTVAFIRHLDTLATSGAEFPLGTYLVNLTFDVIGSTVMDETLNTQATDPSQQGELVQLFKEILHTYKGERSSPSWWLTPRKYRRRRLAAKLDSLIQDIIRRKHTEQLNSTRKTKSRSILSLSLQDVDTLTPALICSISHQIKTFLLAGHDTTSYTLAWAFYELSRTPHAMRRVKEELDDLLGSDSHPDSVRAKLLSPEGPELVNRMLYISAVMKETLRLHQPAGTARKALSGKGFTIRTPTGDEYCLDNMSVYLHQGLIHRDKAVYGDTANDFLPERWLSGPDDEISEKSGIEGIDNIRKCDNIPAGAFRPFERGPRNCIGQEFANIESRVIIAMVARKYDFTKIGLGEIALDGDGQPTIQENGQFATKSELYNIREVTAKPADRMRMVVSLAT